MHNEAGPRTPPPLIIRSYCAGSMNFATLMQHAVGEPGQARGLYLRANHVGLPVASVEEADALVAKMLRERPNTEVLRAPAPYANHGYAVCFEVVAVACVDLLPPTPPPVVPVAPAPQPVGT